MAIGIGILLPQQGPAQTPVTVDTTAFELQNPGNQLQDIPDLSHILPEDLADQYTLDSVHHGIYQTQPEVIE